MLSQQLFERILKKQHFEFNIYFFSNTQSSAVYTRMKALEKYTPVNSPYSGCSGVVENTFLNMKWRYIMAFFEQIGKRITNVGQGVAKQTKNLTDITRLNAEIAEKKETMSQLLFEMGHDYYQKHRKDTDCEEQEYVNQLNALFLEIMKCQDEVEMLKASNTCKVCGARLAENASFCMNCGAKLGSNESEERNAENENPGRKCPVCGAEAEDEDMFCTVCGAKLDWEG